MKKIIYLIITLSTILLYRMEFVQAQKETYINSKNVELNYVLYEKLCDIYSTNYTEYISQERYEELLSTDFNNIKVIEVDLSPLIQAFSSQHETTYKTLKIINNSNVITLDLKWKNMPSTRS